LLRAGGLPHNVVQPIKLVPGVVHQPGRRFLQVLQFVWRQTRWLQRGGIDAVRDSIECSDAEEWGYEPAVWKGGEPAAWEKPVIYERRSSDKCGAPNKPSADATEAANGSYSKASTAHCSKATETTAAVHFAKVAKATKPSLRWNRYQGGADDCGCRETSQ
jgi:hypothetical protein